jgi:hypothetical protein
MFAFLTLLACSGSSPSDSDPGTTGDTSTPSVAMCPENSADPAIPAVAFDAEGPYGKLRHDLAEDFTLPLMDGSEWHFAERWTGCESYVFVPDSILRVEDDDRPVYAEDVDALIAASPLDAHYFFVSVNRDDAVAEANQATAQDTVDAALVGLSEDDAAFWADHLHVVPGRAQDLGNWVEAELTRGIGVEGFAIDRSQHVRGIGGFADVTRYNPAFSWPYENNLAYAAHEARYFDMEAARDAKLADEDATVVPMWTGEVISQYADMAVALPSAEEMAGFDTMEIDIDMRCPDPDLPEFGNCGAWDYIAGLYVQEEDTSLTELGRFITTYHREAHWVLDATPMMVHLLDGGTRTFRWSWAPEWNVQPTETRVSLRFSNQGKGYAPRGLTLLATGGGFGSTYNDGRTPVDIPIPAAAKKVDLWAVISGHGNGTNNCAEFCNHQHEFTVDGSTHTQKYPDAQSEEGCITDIEGQMTPNQWGTWWFGRGGWCPGGIVHPYDVDVTDEVTPGSDATLSYRGLYRGDTPPDGSGDIVMNAWVVEYE